jgi:hypothetical protein
MQRRFSITASTKASGVDVTLCRNTSFLDIVVATNDQYRAVTGWCFPRAFFDASRATSLAFSP